MCDLNTKEEKVLPEMNFARLWFSSIILGLHIYVFGGVGDAVGGMINSCTNSCER